MDSEQASKLFKQEDWKRWYDFVRRNLGDIGLPPNKIKVMLSSQDVWQEVKALGSLGIPPGNIILLVDNEENAELSKKNGVRGILHSRIINSRYFPYVLSYMEGHVPHFLPLHIVKLRSTNPFNKDINDALNYLLERVLYDRCLLGISAPLPSDKKPLEPFTRSHMMPDLADLCGINYSSLPFKGSQRRIGMSIDDLVSPDLVIPADLQKKHSAQQIYEIDLRPILDLWKNGDFYLNDPDDLVKYRFKSGEGVIAVSDFMYLNRFTEILQPFWEAYKLIAEAFMKNEKDITFEGKKEVKRLIGAGYTFKSTLGELKNQRDIPKVWRRLPDEERKLLALKVIAFGYAVKENQFSAIKQYLNKRISPLLDVSQRGAISSKRRTVSLAGEETGYSQPLNGAIRAAQPLQSTGILHKARDTHNLQPYHLMTRQVYGECFSFQEPVDLFHKRVDASKLDYQKRQEIYRLIKESGWYKISPAYWGGGRLEQFLNEAYRLITQNSNRAGAKEISQLFADVKAAYPNSKK